MESTIGGQKIELIEQIGEGGFGQVWIGKVYENSMDSKVFKYAAIKFERFETEKKYSLHREYTVMENIGPHENIIGCISFAAYFEKNLKG
jgi:hypothetical protein